MKLKASDDKKAQDCSFSCNFIRKRNFFNILFVSDFDKMFQLILFECFSPFIDLTLTLPWPWLDLCLTFPDLALTLPWPSLTLPFALSLPWPFLDLAFPQIGCLSVNDVSCVGVQSQPQLGLCYAELCVLCMGNGITLMGCHEKY